MEYSKQSEVHSFAFLKGIIIIGIFIMVVLVFLLAEINQNFENMRKLEIQNESNSVLYIVEKSLNQVDLEDLGLRGTVSLTPDVLNSLEVKRVISYLSEKRKLNDNDANSVTLNNPNIKIGDLRRIINSQTQNILIDSKGYLVKEPYFKEDISNYKIF